MLRRWRKSDGATAVGAPAADVAGMRAEIERLSSENRTGRSAELELRIRELRHRAGIELVAAPGPEPSYCEPAAEPPPLGDQSRVSELDAADLSPEALRSAMLSSGCLLVRGLVDPDRAAGMADAIERAMAARSDSRNGVDVDGLYDELQAEGGFEIVKREWIEEGGGLLAADSPRLLFETLDLFEEAGIPRLVEAYLGERPAISAQKFTLRKATPDVGGAWHQDGSFLGDVRSLNLWVSLSRCGDVAPSMDIVPQRLDGLVETGGEGTWIAGQISPATAERAAGDLGVVRPIFDPGDALLFDELFLHQTGTDAAMPNPRYAIETWCFGPSGYAAGNAPLAL